jgi:hypothetical protein
MEAIFTATRRPPTMSESENNAFDGENEEIF